VGHLDHVNIDDDLIAIHHHAKWYKFGITRSWDTLSIEIRMGRLTRGEAIDVLRRTGDETPWDDIRLFCEYLGIGIDEYFDILEGPFSKAKWSAPAPSAITRSRPEDARMVISSRRRVASLAEEPCGSVDLKEQEPNIYEKLQGE